ncbi:DUF4124 domain-containing protein [Delftia sp. WSY_9]|jgi:hypothetical protein|uniref:DUF4124 domain-containing protein n=1 Tax=unclassified Delftia TaxID=2613839 RepID=UPI00370A3384
MRSTRHAVALAACLLAIGGQALAINKCKDANGKVTYQEHACTNDSKSAEVINAAPAMDTGADQASAQARLAKMRDDNEKFDAMISGKVMRGMSESQVKNSWGSPTKINKTIGSNGVNEQWVYRRGGGVSQYVYLENGVVTSIQSPQ